MEELDKSRIDEAAELLLSVRTSADRIDDLPDQLRPKSLEQSYMIQARLNEKLAAAGYGSPAGFKIGCTTAVMQEYLDIPHPCAGQILEKTIRHGQGSFNRSALCRPGVECEIAVRIDRDMISDRMFSAECCEGFVGSAMASIELVDDRWTDFRKVSTPALVSENFFNAGCVLGRPVNVSGSKLKDVVGQMRINGTQAGAGSGSEILGHPYAALAWLANHQMKQSAPLKARDFVTLGSVVQTRWIDVGDVVEIEFTELGKCSLHLGP